MYLKDKIHQTLIEIYPTKCIIFFLSKVKNNPFSFPPKFLFLISRKEKKDSLSQIQFSLALCSLTLNLLQFSLPRKTKLIQNYTKKVNIVCQLNIKEQETKTNHLQDMMVSLNEANSWMKCKRRLEIREFMEILKETKQSFSVNIHEMLYLIMVVKIHI